MSNEARTEVGETLTYPHEKGWDTLAELPEAAALVWTITACPQAEIGGYRNVTAQMIHDKTTTYRWKNKLAVVVNTDRYYPIAIYNHDGKYYIIRKMR